MRFAVLSLFCFSACAADGLPIGQGSVQVTDGGARDLRGTTTGGTTAGTTTMGGTTTGGTTGPGTTTGGTTGSNTPCKTACDCPAGQACFQGGCVTSMFGKLFCCESMDCPDGQFCQSGNDGSFGQCGGGNSGGTTGGTINVDLGTGGGQCQFIPCQGDRVCRRSGCNGGCNTMTGRCQP